MEEKNVDKRKLLDEEPFSYRINKDKKVFIYWNNKEIVILGSKKSEEFLSKIQNATIKEAQLIMAKATGNFKHGNEKDNR